MHAFLSLDLRAVIVYTQHTHLKITKRSYYVRNCASLAQSGTVFEIVTFAEQGTWLVKLGVRSFRYDAYTCKPHIRMSISMTCHRTAPARHSVENAHAANNSIEVEPKTAA